MKYEAGNRFNPDTYFKTEVDSTSVTVKVTGELEGVEVSFDSGDVPEITSLSVTENGTYEAPEGTAYDPVTVEVPNTYTESDEGKVVDQGALVAQTSRTVTTNDTYDTTTNNEVVVEVPNTYTAADEGKVVSSGELVSQTSTTKTANGTYDTTLNNEVVVAVPSGSDPQLAALIDGSITDLVVPNGVTSIAQYLCFGNTNIETVKVPEGVTTIDSFVLQNCTNLESIELPSTITDIGNNFARLFNVTTTKALSVTLLALDPPTLGNDVFTGRTTASMLVIYVPDSVVNTYRGSAKWASISDSFIQPIPTT